MRASKPSEQTDAMPAYELYPVVAMRVAMPTPRLKRITIDARAIAGLRRDLPAQWLKVFVPKDTRRSGGRAYTIRRFDPSDASLDLDFVLHGDDGDISAWAARAETGAAFEISRPHPRSGFALDPTVGHYLLAGDETGLPGIAAILEALPATARAHVVVEVADAGERQPLRSAASLTVTWLQREATGEPSLRDVIRDGPIPRDAAVWIAAESSVTASIRGNLKARGIPDHRRHVTGYWKRGEADHRDPNDTP